MITLLNLILFDKELNINYNTTHLKQSKMKPETKQIKKLKKYDFDATQEKEFDEYIITKFVSVLEKEKREKTILINELDNITEGQSIVLSNAK